MEMVRPSEGVKGAMTWQNNGQNSSAPEVSSFKLWYRLCNIMYLPNQKTFKHLTVEMVTGHQTTEEKSWMALAEGPVEKKETWSWA